MSFNHFSSSFIYVLCLVLLLSCQSKRNYDGGLQTTEVKAERTVYAEGSTTDKLQMSATIEYPSAHVNADVLLKLQQLVKTASLGNAYEGESAQQAVADWMDELEAEYEAENRYFLSSEADEEVRATFSAENFVDASIYSICDGMMSYQVRSYVYSGGAHGLSSTNYIVIDLHNGQVLTETDIFPDKTDDQLTEMLREAFVAQKNMSEEELTERGFELDAIFANSNFYLNDDSVVFVFNPYDIAPYAEGEQRIALIKE